MILAMFRVMALALWRDRGALVMTFLLPPLVFLIFSAVFAGATGEDVKLKLAIADDARTPASRRLADALLRDPDLRAERTVPDAGARVRALVKAGRADAGLIIRADPAASGSPIIVVSDPSRAVAAPLTMARAQQVLARDMPDILLARTLVETAPAVGGFTRRQTAAAAVAMSSLAEGRAVAVGPSLFVREDISGARKGGGAIAYYAGAVSILFALFSAMTGALSLIDERHSGIADRILAGTRGMGPVVTGKFLFLIAQGVVQATAIFATAELIYGVPVLGHIGPWLITTIAASTCSAGLALGIVAFCKTRDQGQMLSTFIILILAAVGGSMVPRFLMPPWLQMAGWATPHAWTIEAYQSILWRDAGLSAVYPAWAVLLAIGLAGLLLAHLATRLVR
ncbi:MAG: ABC transporter permease [Caulobacter sp.]